MSTPTPTPDSSGNGARPSGDGSDQAGERQPSDTAPTTPPAAAPRPGAAQPTTPQPTVPQPGAPEFGSPAPVTPSQAAPSPVNPAQVAPAHAASPASEFGDPPSGEFGPPGLAAPAGPFAAETAPTPPPPSRIREVLLAVGVAALITALGFPLGWLWSAAAPWVPAEKIPGAAVLAQPEQEQMIAEEGWYLLITVVAGLLLAVLAWVLLRRYRGGLMLLGLAVGGVFGGVLTLKFGHHIGYAHFVNLVRDAPNGTQFLAPVNLRVQETGLWHHWLPYARGDVLALAIAASALYLLLAGFSAHPSLRGPDPAQAQQPGAPAYLPAGDYYPAPAAGGYPLTPPNGGYPPAPPAAAPPAAQPPAAQPPAEPNRPGPDHPEPPASGPTAPASDS
ncbi:hypothetical protein GCM10023322_66450 [Rugosimonospora acidiphila]|uniref:DUF2567 domain-containing protein n=1 Tax=Rugosimonospora acidiphila TaxID=556531 RepID=A0ABP9SLE4_9ACTN